MTQSRGGHHGDVAYVFEDAGFDTEPTDTEFKNFGGNATLDTFDGSHNAVRVFNADRKAAEVIEQTFDGSWSVTISGLTEPPWWLAALFGQPTTTNISGSLYEHVYGIETSNEPISLRLYAPTEGFSDYVAIPGAAVASVTVDQDADGSPDVTIDGAYAREPFTESSLSPEAPAFSQSSFTNRDAELQSNGDTVAKAQSASVSLAGNTDMIGEIGSENAVDFVPRAWEPSTDWEKIIATDQTVDPRQTFEDGGTYTTSLRYDNGETSDGEYSVEWAVSGALPNDWSESGRNDPDADLVESLSELAADATITMRSDDATPPGV